MADGPRQGVASGSSTVPPTLIEHVTRSETGDPVRAPASLPRGTCVGRYILLEMLGEGGMGVVYNAYDPELHRPIALKLLRAGSRGCDADPAMRDRLLREAQALARLSHPNVVAIHDVGTFEDQVFLAMEFLEGE